MTSEVPHLGFQGTWSRGSWCSALHTLHTGCVILPKTWWLDPKTVSQMTSLQSDGDLRDHVHVIHLTFTHSFHFALFIPVTPKTGTAPPTFRPVPTLLQLQMPPLSLVRLPQFISLSPQEGVPTSTRRKFWQSRPTSEGLHWIILSTCTAPQHLPAPEFDTFCWTVETRWCLAILTLRWCLAILTLNRGSDWLGDQQFAAHWCELKPPYLPPLPGASPSDITLLNRHFLPQWRGPPLPPPHNRLSL